MKLLFDFFPIALFFVAFKVYDIYVATIVAIVATCLQVGYTRLKHKKVETMHLITLLLIVVLGGATLYLQDERFIKWKPTIVNWLFGVAFLGSQLIGKHTFMERMMKSNLSLPRMIWRRLNLSWAMFFILLGFINLYVMQVYDTDTWVNFKLFGMLGLTFVFVLLQAVYLSRYVSEPEKEES